ncbi:MAG TPA: C40 family peptidase, partial [Vampirovibrionales bacterium]
SGLVTFMLKQLSDDIELPRRSQDMYLQLDKEISLEDAKQGDLLFFKTGGGVSHVGLYWDDQNGIPQMFHASSSRGVEFRELNPGDYWMNRLVGVKRIEPVIKALHGEKEDNPSYISEKIDDISESVKDVYQKIRFGRRGWLRRR